MDLGKAESAYVASLDKISEFVDLVTEDPEAALELYDGLHDEVKRLPEIQRLHIEGALGVSDEAYRASLDELARQIPDSPSLPLMLIDAHILDEDFAAAHADVGSLDEIVDGDPYLDIVRSQLYQGAGEYGEALASVESAVERDPRLAMPAAWELLEIAIVTEDFEEVYEQLSWLFTRSDFAHWDVSETEGFEPFHESKPGQRWAEFIEEEIGDLDDR